MNIVIVNLFSKKKLFTYVHFCIFRKNGIMVRYKFTQILIVKVNISEFLKESYDCACKYRSYNS
jgi:hypothetical protein